MNSASGNADHNGSANGEAAVRALSIAVVDPDLERRNLVAGVVCALRSSPVAPRVTTLTDVADSGFLMSQGFNVIFVAVDRNQEAALKTIEAISRSGRATAMAYAQRSGDDLLIRCMRAGVREFLLYPFSPSAVEDAFDRLEGRGQLKPNTKNVGGKSFAFLGAKGGTGVTTAACNFA